MPWRGRDCPWPANHEAAAHSGACRRSMVAPTSAGARRRVAIETTTITVNASGTVHAAGWAVSVAGQPVSGGPSTVTSTAADRRAAADQHAGRRAERRSGRATRCRAPAAGRSWTRRPRRPARPPARRPARRRCSASTERHRAGDHRGQPEIAYRAAPPSTSVEITPATLVSRPDEVDRKAANAPGGDQRGEQLAGGAVAQRRAGQQHHHRVGLAGDQQLRGVDPAEHAVERGQQVERRRPGPSTTRVVRRAAAPSGLV